MTTPPLHLGKKRGMRRMATPEGHFTMVALDQRPPLAQLIGAKRGIAPAQVSFADMVAVKGILADALGAHASALLFDPNYALPAALPRLPAHTGLVLTLEDHRFRETPGGRLSHSIDDWSVEKIKRAGGDGVKLLAWYRPDAAPKVRAYQQDYVRQIGRQCRQCDIPLVLELLVYPFPGSHRHSHSPGAAGAPEKMSDETPELVLASVREFARPEYGVDLFKLESPLPGATLPARDGGAAHQAAQGWFGQMGAICAGAGIPWVMLSAGVTPAQFLRVMEYAYAAGAHGFLAGRALWWQALQHFPDLERCAEQLRREGSATFAALAALTLRAGNAWHPDYSAFDALQAEGELCASYA
ncbi:tagatose 1,6-diphosphate aldolase [Verminephrobacter eiseniae]|uniref:Tagatose-bisphosphate aldolase n=1 Tax=Verminephrobacter eiseniae (strain EF01-2) TaxID=391735 RepID=A1WG21_VEREI|nr:tagatose 1,6-diphosphate aldolase [Verminephrobacter eiseniae]ABM56578.1 tagatose-bisphosphate aldolase [Verminephrobacter eiseniae EF01-2]MCW5286935.1 tagatose 1,6-diphosphate aldolase [Verminephrobacter eiseniae]MCW5305233.1 tagatose 1,6-diphosphate aldolase [Verminephrobacter eiseniae]MCW8180891.1 tagatose 1,6-diphosphate aldolase [Verminephrobacter eiseniae]MCW8189471.1 tagatose 1,6-diphosphate aldolase [Verminephrobacter eiseniae]